MLQKSKKKNLKVYKKLFINFKPQEFSFIAPKFLSLIKNPEETKKFFLDIIECYTAQTSKKLSYNNTIFLDLSKIQYVTPEAIMYIIAITKSLKTSILHKINIRGNFPKNENAKNVLLKSGFLNYVNSNVAKISTNNPTIQIISGKSVDADAVAKVIDFIREKSSCRSDILRHLYTMLIEIMTNTVQHAYNNKQVLKCNWYMYIEIGDNINITILDTGDGIPTTVSRRITDMAYIFSKIKDSRIISSALDGAFRTETKKNYRGKGLPHILECYNNTYIKELCIVSGKGSVSICKNSNERKYYDSHENFYGTVFYISI